ncbi:SPW repeat protein [Streptomyces aurantiogriseus]|uniref:Membrane protein n=1 Tax=Streptomyces aurantiogriseus TaxID=66870 RepID=A0A918KYL9_9ACTN|nr:SPW repeat protein [Streptomyces aurantiogriseus]GGR46243.1 membrane protein [Streptomyces aurantiogriseus]
MANVSPTRGDMSTHPDVSEMGARYARMLGGRDVALVDGPVFLLGLYCAVSPWILHYTASQPALVTHNLIVGTAIGLLALGFTAAPARMYGLSWAMCALGIWMIIAPWVVGDSPDAGVVLNNIIIGALALVLGLMCAGAAARSAPKA